MYVICYNRQLFGAPSTQTHIMELVYQRTGATERVYLDAGATTPPLPKALEAMLDTARHAWGNPSSSYQEGVIAKGRLDSARKTFSDIMGVEPCTIHFTSCGTESNNIALRSVMCRAMKEGRNVLISSAVEHPSVKRTASAIGCTHVQIRVNRMGYIDTDQLSRALYHYGPRVAMVSIIFAQNEVGTLQPITYISQMIRRQCPAAIIHTDATQIFGKDYIEPKILGVDMMTGSAHKFHGPRGVGILYAREGIIDAYVTPMTGGGQEHGCRSGTENVPAIVGAAVAFKEALGNKSVWRERFNTIMANRNYMMEYLQRSIPGLIVNGDPRGRSLPNILSVSFPGGVHGHMMSEYLDKQGISVGSGSACSKGKPSETLQAMYGLSKQAETVIHNTIRISLTMYTTRSECDYAASHIVNGWKTMNARVM